MPDDRQIVKRPEWPMEPELTDEFDLEVMLSEWHDYALKVERERDDALALLPPKICEGCDHKGCERCAPGPSQYRPAGLDCRDIENVR